MRRERSRIDWRHEYAISDWLAERDYRPEFGTTLTTWRYYLRRKTHASVLRSLYDRGFVAAQRRGRDPLRRVSVIGAWQLALVCTDFDEKQYDGHSDTPEQERQYQAKELWNCVERLPKRERDMLQLYYLEDMNLEDIGKLYGISESRTCQILSKARKRLKQHLLAPPAPPKAEPLPPERPRECLRSASLKARQRSTRRYTTREML